MDGVLADFKSRYEEKFGEFPSVSDKREQHFWDNWKVWVDDREFENLELHPSAKQLLEYVKSLPDVEILTSTSGGYSHEIVTEQKRRWLHKNNIHYTLNVTPGGRRKAKYANNQTALVDDTEKNVYSFAEAGGYGILHVSSVDTIKQINLLMEIL